MNPDLERIAQAVQACPAVAGLHSGPGEETVTYLRRGRLVGVRVVDGQLAIGVIGHYPAAVAEIADQVRAAAAPYVADMTVIVTVEDLHVIDDDPQTEHDLGSAGPRPRPGPGGGSADQPRQDPSALE